MKIKLFKMKRGSMTAEHMVAIILLLAGFVILFLIFYQVGWEGEINREVCHESVIVRATLPSIVENSVPLKCPTKKVCIGGENFLKNPNCKDEFGDLKGITKVEVKDKTQIEKYLSTEIADCWAMMGEGKVSLFSQYWSKYGFGDIYPTCVICSRIAFDEKSLDDKKISLKEINLEEYMDNHKMPTKEISYTKYISGEGGKTSVEGYLFGEEKPEEAYIEKIEEATKPTDNKEIAILFMQISSPTKADVLKNLVLSTALFDFASTRITGKSPVSSIAKLCKKSGGVAIGCLAVGSIVVGGAMINTQLNQGVSEGYCGDITVGDEAREGCSVVRTVNYNMNDIKKYCSVVESI